MNCSNCPHFNVCESFGVFMPKEIKSTFDQARLDLINNKWKNCKFRNDKSRIIELPCNAGDIVYVLEYEDDCAVDYSGYIFIMANNDFAFLSPIINGERNPIEICNAFFDRYINFDDNSGIIVPLNELYLTKKEAETRLKELNER